MLAAAALLAAPGTPCCLARCEFAGISSAFGVHMLPPSVFVRILPWCSVAQSVILVDVILLTLLLLLLLLRFVRCA